MATTKTKVKNKKTRKTSKPVVVTTETTDGLKWEPFSSVIDPDRHKQLKVYAALHNKKLYEALNDVLKAGFAELGN